MPVSCLLLSRALRRRFDAVVVMPQSIMVNGSVTTSGGSFSAGCGFCVASAAMIFFRCFDTLRPVARPRRIDADGPRAHNRTGLHELVQVQIEQPFRIRPEAALMNNPLSSASSRENPERPNSI